MKVDFSDLNYQYNSIKKNIDKNIKNVVVNSSFIGGDYLNKFENKFAKFCGAKYCIGVGNGTDALEIAIESLNLPKNSEIIIPANTFIATAEAVIRSGNRIVFADVHYNNNLINENNLEKYINKKTAAIIPVHLFGQSCNMQAIMRIAKKFSLKVIEDCSQAHGATFNKKHVGTFGHLGTFSFYPGKNLGGFGDGGAIITNQSLLNNICKRLSNHGRLNKFDHRILGRNSRLDNIQASILIEKLNLLPKWIEMRNNNAIIYKKYLNSKYIDLPVSDNKCYHSFHLFVVKIKNRDLVRKLLLKKGISTGIHYPESLNKNKIFKHNKRNKLPVSNKLAKIILSLPIHESLTLKKIKYVSNSLNKIIREIS